MGCPFQTAHQPPGYPRRVALLLISQFWGVSLENQFAHCKVLGFDSFALHASVRFAHSWCIYPGNERGTRDEGKKGSEVLKHTGSEYESVEAC